MRQRGSSRKVMILAVVGLLGATVFFATRKKSRVPADGPVSGSATFTSEGDTDSKDPKKNQNNTSPDSPSNGTAGRDPTSEKSNGRSGGASGGGAGSNGDGADGRKKEILEFVNGLPGKQNWDAHMLPDGSLAYLAGGLINEEGVTKERAFKFASKLFPKLANSVGELSNNVVDPNSSDLSSTYHFEQSYSGYRVYKGYITVSSRKPAGDIYMVTTGVKELGSPDLTLKKTRAEIESILQQYYTGREPHDWNVELTPVVYSTAPGASELAWVSRVHLSKPKIDRVEVIFSARDGRFLAEVPLLVH